MPPRKPENKQTNDATQVTVTEAQATIIVSPPTHHFPGNTVEDREGIEMLLPFVSAAVTFPLHLDIKLTTAQSNVLRGIAAGLDREQRRLACGRRVVSTADAIRYILELASPEAPETPDAPEMETVA